MQATHRALSKFTRVCLGNEGCSVLATKSSLGEVQGRTYVVLHGKDDSVGGGPKGLSRPGLLPHTAHRQTLAGASNSTG
jgi:hypothetical protein